METLILLLQQTNPIHFFSLIFFLYLVLIFLFQRFNSYPVNWPFFGMLPSLLLNYHRLHDFVTDMLVMNGGTKEFKGPWFSSMGFILTADPINTNHIGSQNFSNYPKGEEYHEIFDVLGDGIFNAEDDSWRSQRKIAMALVGAPRFRNFIANCTQDKVEKGLLPFLNQMADLGKPFNLQDICSRLTHDTTCNLVFGIDPGCLSLDLPTLPFAEALDQVEEVILFRHVVPKFWWKLLRLLNIMEEKKMAIAWAQMDHFISQVIKERRSNVDISNKGLLPLDLLTSYMNSDTESDPDSYKSNKFLRDTMLTFLAAGKDTIGSALTWFFALVSTNREVEAKILQELEDTEFSNEDMGKLVYLHAALCETLRLYPSVPFNHKKSVRPDVLPSGQRIPAGTMVLISPYAMGRMEGIWGKDRFEFKPERWITEEGKIRHEPSYKFLAFNTGPRSCLGKDMSFTQLKMVAAAVLPKFQFELVEGHVIKPRLSIVLYMRNGLMVRTKRRR